MIHPEASATATVRSVFVIDGKGIVRLTLTYPAATGRNFDEILRVVDSLQLTDNHKVATPVNWRHGEDVVVLPSISNEDADKLFPRGYKQIKPYLRLTPDPTKAASEGIASVDHTKRGAAIMAAPLFVSAHARTSRHPNAGRILRIRFTAQYGSDITT